MKSDKFPSSKNVEDRRANTQGSTGYGYESTYSGAWDGGNEKRSGTTGRGGAYFDRFNMEDGSSGPGFSVQRTGSYQGIHPEDAVETTYKSDEKK